MKYHTAVPIGRGGMGEVLRAWDPTLNRHVALKLLRSSDPELEERMLREARAQARVSHSNICPVYEVGRHEGRVFIAMQLIDGRPLNEAAADLGIEQKARLLQIVAEAVHAAHTAGLVHRDIKPANILVERTPDGDLKPWVMDFGIARMVEVEGATMTGQVLGTPGYLSPEQARGEVSTIDRRSDVFSLGVVLYELLAGCKPHPGDSDMATLVSLLQDDPVPLRRRAPHVPRDLETVVMTCLDPDRERRYDSARALADDLGRFLAGETILARPTGIGRRIAVRARRHPVMAGLLAAAAVTVAVLGIGLAASWAKYTRDLKKERDLARQAQVAAESREREASQMADSLAAMFNLANPVLTGGKDLTARQLLELGEQRLTRELSAQPARLARLLRVISISYLDMGLRQEAERVARRALALRQETQGMDSLEVAESLVTLARAMAHESEPEAEGLLRQALDIQRRHLGDTSPDVATTRNRLADLLLHRGALDEAEAHNRKARAVLVTGSGSNSSAALNALDTAAKILRRQSRTEEAATLFADIVERRRRAYGDDDPALAPALNNLAYTRKLLGDLAGAEINYRAALDLIERIWGGSHPDRLQVMFNLTAVLENSGRDAEMEDLLREIVVARKGMVPAGDWRIGSDLLAGIGRFLILRNRWAEALQPTQEGLAIYESGLGREHPWTATARGQLAACLFALARPAEAAALAASSLAVLEGLRDLPQPVRDQLERGADYFEAAGKADLAARYRAILARSSAATVAPTPSRAAP